jgi:hypothetical protein
MKGECHALDDLRDSYDYVASGVSQRIYDWRIHPYPAGHRNCRGSDQDYSREKSFVTRVKNKIIIDDSIGMPDRRRLVL